MKRWLALWMKRLDRDMMRAVNSVISYNEDERRIQIEMIVFPRDSSFHLCVFALQSIHSWSLRWINWTGHFHPRTHVQWPSSLYTKITLGSTLYHRILAPVCEVGLGTPRSLRLVSDGALWCTSFIIISLMSLVVRFLPPVYTFLSPRSCAMGASMLLETNTRDTISNQGGACERLDRERWGRNDHYLLITTLPGPCSYLCSSDAVLFISTYDRLMGANNVFGHYSTYHTAQASNYFFIIR